MKTKLILKFSAPNTISGAIREFDPSSFAMVMASGIVSLACHQQGMRTIPILLFRFNEVLYALLWAVLSARFLFFRSSSRIDLFDFVRNPGIFTIVAATCILGIQFAVLIGSSRIAAILWYAGGTLWFIVFYAFLAVNAAQRVKRCLWESVNGELLLVAVSTQSVSILGSLTTPFIANAKETFLFIALCMFLAGAMLYMFIITAILYRLMTVGISPKGLAPSYWINMGGAAISTLAGATLIIESHQLELFGRLAPVLTVGSLFFWLIGSLWVPVLVILGAWYHLFMRKPLAKASRYWSLVFPLGMYSACSFQLAVLTGRSFLLTVSHVFNYAALLAWAATFIGVSCQGIRFIRRSLTEN